MGLRVKTDNGSFVSLIAHDIFQMSQIIMDEIILEATYTTTLEEESGTPLFKNQESLKILRGGYEEIYMFVWRIKMKFRDFMEAERRRLVKRDFSDSDSDEFDGSQLELEPVNLQSPAP